MGIFFVMILVVYLGPVGFFFIGRWSYFSLQNQFLGEVLSIQKLRGSILEKNGCTSIVERVHG